MLFSFVGNYTATCKDLWISSGQALGNKHSILFSGLVAKDCCFLCLTRPFVTCYLIVPHVEEIAFFQGLLETSYLQFLLFCILHTNPKRRLVQGNGVKNQEKGVESPDSIHYIQSKGMLLHTVCFEWGLLGERSILPLLFTLCVCVMKMRLKTLEEN